MATERNGLKAWIRYDANNKAVAGSLIYQKNKPTSGVWKEYIEGGSDINYGDWKLVKGGDAGDGVVLVDDPQNLDEFTFVGPNDRQSDGWVYLTRYFPDGADLVIDYEFASFDGDTEYDRPVYWTSNIRPTGEPGIITPRVNEVPSDSAWNTFVNPGRWFSVGVYSSDSCCGRGFLSTVIDINEFVPFAVYSNTLSFPITYTSISLRCDDSPVGNTIYTDVTVNNIQEAADLFNSNINSLQYGKFSPDTENPNVLKLITSQTLKDELCFEGSLTLYVFSD